MILRIIDFETTGQPPEASVIEAAFIDLVGDNMLDMGSSWYVKPNHEISIEARAVHHIDPLVVEKEGVSWEVTEERLMIYSPTYFVAHNADFEKNFFNPPGARWIDTYKAALRLWPEAPRHSNQFLRYYLERCDPGEDGMPPHRALPDCEVTALILMRCLEMNSAETLEEWSKEPALLPFITFGKHRGKSWDLIPLDYLQWMKGQTFDEAVMFAVTKELERRGK